MSDKKISEKGVSNAAELLYKGAKMLAYSCPDCKVPLFEKDGKIFCPSCGREAVIEDEKEKSEYLPEKNEVKKEGVGLEKEIDLRRKIELAMSKICDMMLQAQSVEEIKDLSESLEKLVDTMKKLK